MAEEQVDKNKRIRPRERARGQKNRVSVPLRLFDKFVKEEQRIRRRRSTFLGKMTGSAAGRECFIIAILFPEIYQFICQKGIELQCMEEG